MLLRAVAAAAAVALVGALSVSTAGAASARVIGPDVSSHNHANRAKLNWHTIRTIGAGKFAFVKATEGRDYVNPNFAFDWTSMRRNGVLRSAYHFARPSGRTKSQIIADATAQADYFVRVAGTFEGPDILPPVLDLESSGSLAPRQMWWWTQAWMDRTEALTGRTPILYTYVNFWIQNMKNSKVFAGYPLWLASYGVSRPGRVGGWKRYTFWQYTSTGRMAGAGLPVDLSVYRGSMTQLRKMTTNRSAKTATSRTLETPRTPLGSKRSSAAVGPEMSRPVPSSKGWMTDTTLRYTTRAPSAAPGSGAASWTNVFGERGIHDIVGH
jgi:lysozyme